MCLKDSVIKEAFGGTCPALPATASAPTGYNPASASSGTPPAPVPSWIPDWCTTGNGVVLKHYRECRTPK
jgi:hypothetical protein